MINTGLLQQAIDESGLPMDELSIRTGISLGKLEKILSGKVEINAPEIQALSHILELPDRKRRMIFFNRDL